MATRYRGDFTSLDTLFGQEDLLDGAARPSYKLNDNVRLEATASYGYEELGDPIAWNKPAGVDMNPDC